MGTPDEIVHALREHGNECAAWVYAGAADLIESLQEQLRAHAHCGDWRNELDYRDDLSDQ